MNIFADDTLTDDFEAACNDPAGFDFGFEKQRKENGYANFGFDPAKAQEMRDKELARIEAIFEGDEEDFEDDLDDEDDYFDDFEDEDDEDDDDFDDLCDDDDDDDFDDVDDWE